MAELRHKGKFFERFQDCHGGLEGAKKWIDERLAKKQGDLPGDFTAEEDRRYHLRHMGSLVDTAHTKEELEASRDQRMEALKVQAEAHPHMKRFLAADPSTEWVIEDTQAN